MKKILLGVVLGVSAFVLGFNSNDYYYDNEGLYQAYRAYKNYYVVTEKFLDELDNHYNWVDAHDPYDYYEAIMRIDSLKTMPLYK